MKNMFKKIRYCDKGSFTIEASLIFPIIFILIITFLCFSIVVYQRVTLYYIASHTAERVAYNWNNSYKNPITGEYPIEKNDGLYWRLTNDKILDLFFGESVSELTQVMLQNSSPQTLPEKKMHNITKKLPTGLKGTIIYKNNLMERTILVQLENPLKIPSFISHLLGKNVQAEAYSTVADPVEFIRNVDLIGTYADRIIEHKDKVKQILESQKNKE